MYHEAVVTVSETIFPSTALAMNFTHKFGEHRISVWSEAWTTTFRRWKITTWNKRVKILLLIMCTYMNIPTVYTLKLKQIKYNDNLKRITFFIHLFFYFIMGITNITSYMWFNLSLQTASFISKVPIHLPIVEFVSKIDQENSFLQYVIQGYGHFVVQTSVKKMAISTSYRGGFGTD